MIMVDTKLYQYKNYADIFFSVLPSVFSSILIFWQKIITLESLRRSCWLADVLSWNFELRSKRYGEVSTWRWTREMKKI